jgi:hypothetical protein
MLAIHRLVKMQKPEGKSLGDFDIHGRIILKSIFEMWAWGFEIDSSGRGQGPVAESCECIKTS